MKKENNRFNKSVTRVKQLIDAIKPYLTSNEWSVREAKTQYFQQRPDKNMTRKRRSKYDRVFEEYASFHKFYATVIYLRENLHALGYFADSR